LIVFVRISFGPLFASVFLQPLHSQSIEQICIESDVDDFWKRMEW